jgi:branched-chain amino acid transport system substrate-binding protein
MAMHARRKFFQSARCVLPLFGIGALLLAGCSSSTNSSSTTAGNGSLKGAPIVLGVIADDSGPTGTTNDMPTTASRWEAYVNSHGGINGHPVNVIVDNDQDNASLALQDAQSLVQTQHAVAIGDASFVDTAFEKYLDSKDIPVLGFSSGYSTFAYATDTNFFSDSVTVLGNLWAVPKAAALAGAKKYGFLYCAEIAACAQAIPLVKGDVDSLGMSLSYTASFSASAASYTAQCLAAQSAGVQALFVAGSVPQSNQRVDDDCAAQNYHPIILTTAGTFSLAIGKDSNIPVVWGNMPTLPWFVTTGSAAQLFHQVMGSYLPQATSAPIVADDWTGLQMFAAAAKTGVATGATPTVQDIYTGLYAMNGNTLDGLTGPLSFVKGKPHPSDCSFIFKIDHGTYSLPDGSSPVCGAGPTPSS